MSKPSSPDRQDKQSMWAHPQLYKIYRLFGGRWFTPTYVCTVYSRLEYLKFFFYPLWNLNVFYTFVNAVSTGKETRRGNCDIRKNRMCKKEVSGLVSGFPLLQRRHFKLLRSSGINRFQESILPVYVHVDWRPETVFLNFYGALESIPRNRFCLLAGGGGPVRQPYIPTRFLAPVECSKIPAQVDEEVQVYCRTIE